MNASSDGIIRVVILDSHALVRAGLKLIVDNQPDMKVVGDSGEAKEALQLVASQQPDIILLKCDPANDIRLEMIQELHKFSNRSRVILLARADEAMDLLRAVQEGAVGIVMKTQPSHVLIKAIQKGYAGEAWIDHSMVSSLISGMTHAHPVIPQDPETERIAQLTPRELKVIQLIGQGMKNRQIAQQLSLSETTIRHYLTNVYTKLGVSDRLELLVFAHRHNLS